MYCPNCKEKMDSATLTHGFTEYRCPYCDFLATWSLGVRGLHIIFNPREEAAEDDCDRINEYIPFGFHEIGIWE